MTTYRKYLKDSLKHNESILIKYGAPPTAKAPSTKDPFSSSDMQFRAALQRTKYMNKKGSFRIKFEGVK